MYSLFIPIYLKSAANLREHWAAKNKREKTHCNAVRLLMKDCSSRNISNIKLIRQAPRLLDDDNLAYAFKHIRDCISDILYPGLAPGRADQHFQFTYSQRKGPYGIEIILY